ncbi:hypothetical protein [Pseudorhodoplanes sp.]|uniref:hypothetical protein n=1 Tax=Pseudorhodoplanes sp. TaxID=1934341 RepID=UPI002D1992C6|nr:hypothetical protein [Pseudorhodoplanes sp.]HWV51685.1 hypothetical protein [Pseudorhodoplanes sp.]
MGSVMLAPVELVSTVICLRIDHSSFHQAWAEPVSAPVANTRASAKRRTFMPPATPPVRFFASFLPQNMMN